MTLDASTSRPATALINRRREARWFPVRIITRAAGVPFAAATDILQVHLAGTDQAACRATQSFRLSTR